MLEIPKDFVALVILDRGIRSARAGPERRAEMMCLRPCVWIANNGPRRHSENWSCAPGDLRLRPKTTRRDSLGALRSRLSARRNAGRRCN